MKCHELVLRIEEMEPDAQPYDVARLCVLMTNYVNDIDQLDDQQFREAWDQMGLRLQAATDQHEAVAEELHAMADKAPDMVDMDDLWTLMRIIKVQAQVLKMYVSPPDCAVQ
jgi:hypothetical protein